MTDPQKISIKEYSYSLPGERIAKYPLAERDASKLLIFKDDKISVDIFKTIADHIPEKSLLLFNNTKVVKARMLFQKPTGGLIEIFCLEPHEQYTDITTAMLQKNKVLWQCLVGGVSKWKKGQILEKKIRQGEKEITLKAGYIEKRMNSFIIELSWLPAHLSFAEILHHAGAIPLPPYINREAEQADAERYQTVYARSDGSVAAPTAGLHFTNSIFNQLKEKNIKTDFVTLHVGAGTFKPVKTETIQNHAMHAEWIDISKAAVKNILNNLENKIIAVGTTSLRAIESLYWLGVKQMEAGNQELGAGSASDVSDMPMEIFNAGELHQWEAYDLAEKKIPVKDALESLLDRMDKKNSERLLAKTQILIAPGYPFKIVNGLVTNFHQPQSTLLLLVAAIIGNNSGPYRDSWKKVYDYALQNDFRFLSYGDGCLLWRSPDYPGHET